MNDLTPVTREEIFLAKLGGQDVETPSPVTREELYLDILCGNSANVPAPFAREEIYLASLCGKNVQIPEPVTRKETFLAALCGEGILPPNPVTREEFFLEDWLDNNGEFLTVTGAIATFTTLRSAPLRSLAVTMEPKQDLHGYDSPWPAGGGKNLLNPNTVTKSETISYESGLWTMNPFEAGAQIIALPFAPNVGNAVSVSFTAWATSGTKARFDGQPDSVYPSGTAFADKTLDLTTSKRRFSYSGNVLEGTTGFRIFRTSAFDGAQSVTIYVEEIQIELGSEPTVYAPYSNICPISGWTGANVHVADGENPHVVDNVYPVSWQSEAGTVYGGTLDVTTGVLTVDRAMVDLGAKNWYPSTAAGRTRFRTSITDIERISSPNVRSSLLCSNYPTKTANQTYQGTTGVSLQQNSADIYIYDPQMESMTGEEFKSAMSGVQLVYELDTPQTYQLTPTEVRALVGINNVWSDADSVTVTYRSN